MQKLTQPTRRLAVLLAATLASQAPASHDQDSPRVPSFSVAVADGIAQQGNEAVRRIRQDARIGARAAQPAALSELALVTTEVAAE